MFAAGLLLQAGIYYYLDNILFAATSDYQIGGTNQQEALGFGVEPDGQAYYSFDKRFMATVVGDRVTIYQAGKRANRSASAYTDGSSLSLNGCLTEIWRFLPATAATTGPANTAFI